MIEENLIRTGAIEKSNNKKSNWKMKQQWLKNETRKKGKQRSVQHLNSVQKLK